jgi:hypothetical protein
MMLPAHLNSSAAVLMVRAGKPPAWSGPTQQEWEQAQQQLQQYQQQQAAMTGMLQQMQDAHNAAIAALQVRVLAEEAVVLCFAAAK